MIDALGWLIRAGFGVVISSLIPLFAAAALAAVVVGLSAGALGVRDAALNQIARVLAVVLALGLVVGSIARATTELATRAWSGLDGSLEVEARAPQR